MSLEVYRNGKWVEKFGPDDDQDYSQKARYYVQNDIQPYASPITGREVSGSRARREDMRRHNCIPVGGSDRPKHMGLTNGFKQ